VKQFEFYDLAFERKLLEWSLSYHCLQFICEQFNVRLGCRSRRDDGNDAESFYGRLNTGGKSIQVSFVKRSQ